MKQCINCGAELKPEAKFCKTCGAKQPEQTEAEIAQLNAQDATAQEATAQEAPEVPAHEVQPPLSEVIGQPPATKAPAASKAERKSLKIPLMIGFFCVLLQLALALQK